jgi:Family of unknown function (DUF6491)
MNAPTLARLALFTALAGASAGPGRAQATATPTPPARACFLGKDVDNFVAVDNQTVNIRVGVRRFYQLKLFTSCIGIGWSRSVALVSRPGSFICTSSPATVDLFIHTTTGRQRCPVTSIRKLSDDEVAAMPKKQRP